MHAVLLLASAAAVSAQGGVFHQIAANGRAISGAFAHAPQVKARQDVSDFSGEETAFASATASEDFDDPSTTDPCYASAISVYDSMPTPAAVLLDYTVTDTYTDLCSYTYPASLTDAISSYTSELLSWLSAETPVLESLASQCTDYSDLLSLTDIEAAIDTAQCTATGTGAQTTGKGTTASPTTKGNAASVTTGSGSAGTAAATGSGSGSGSNSTLDGAAAGAASQEAVALARTVIVAVAAGALVMAAL